MAEYTATVYELMKNNFDFGLQEYPIWNEDFRPILNNMILQHFKRREICCINPWDWRDMLQERMYLIMREKYNAIFEALTIKFNPLYNIDITETFKRENGSNTNIQNTIDNTSKDTNSSTSHNEGNESNDGSNHVTMSNFPTQKMTTDEIRNPIYATNAQLTTQNMYSDHLDNTTNTGASESSATTKGKNTTDTTATDEYTKVTQGSSAMLPFSKAMRQYLDYIKSYNVFTMIFKDLNQLFMTIW